MLSLPKSAHNTILSPRTSAFLTSPGDSLEEPVPACIPPVTMTTGGKDPSYFDPCFPAAFSSLIMGLSFCRQ